jgi:DNA polymerase I-like protein with 3'-5' exonuclease and polymerase domains
LVFEVPQEELEAIKEVVFDEMPAALELDVSLKVDIKWGNTWGDME